MSNNMGGIVITNVEPADAELLRILKKNADHARQMKRALQDVQHRLAPMPYQDAIIAYADKKKNFDLMACFKSSLDGADIWVAYTLTPFWKLALMLPEICRRIHDAPPIDGVYVHEIVWL